MRWFFASLGALCMVVAVCILVIIGALHSQSLNDLVNKRFCAVDKTLVTAYEARYVQITPANDPTYNADKERLFVSINSFRALSPCKIPAPKSPR